MEDIYKPNANMLPDSDKPLVQQLTTAHQ